MIRPIALTFALAVALAPAAAVAQVSGGSPGAPFPRERPAHAPMRRAPREARMARPWVGQVPPEDQYIPPISRDPNDCVKTMCTCLAGGGC